MIGLPAATRIYLAREPVDMRKGPDGLVAQVRASFTEDVFSGHVFVFLSRRLDRTKLLWWDRGGFVVLYKRLEAGRFRRPRVEADGQVVLSVAELHSLLEGIDLTHAPRAKLWSPRVA
ncbi:MAG TPA: IS66 family insertion sequence hypothetical protein [Candidatus Accumulibacter sp.]|nr:IS66 family insertion sequence hypothetical protein [Accumulibacter sp.]